ncbi:HD domain-containing phosphohydrolase [Desulfotomaculum sp. 1211_IL3151]|uniref:HD domain-containing phosphohydrolase n=1 Tax=Desulfotomaculum sp. 1211_IL3151 TaxID=3084055 RepID=UPI002FDA83BF
MLPNRIELANLIEGLSLAVDLAEGRPLQHSKDVAYLTLSIGKAVGLPAHQMDILYFAGLLHDITITSQEGFCPLCDTVRQYGMEHLIPVLLETDNVIHTSRELWDCSGPQGWCAQEIPLNSRILALAVAIDKVGENKQDFWNWRERIQDYLKHPAGIPHDPELVKLVKALLKDRRFTSGLFNLNRDKELEKYRPRHSIPVDSIMLEILGKAFALFIDQKTPYTANHSWDVAKVSQRIADHLGFDAQTKRNILIASLLHDLGKITVPNSILEKSGPLTHQEFAIIKNHPYYSALILDRIPELELISLWASAHHERLDGSGYHLGTKGDSLPPEAKLIAVADVYASLAVNRPYRKCMELRELVNTMNSMTKNNHLDSKYVNVILELLTEHPCDLLK